MVLPAPARLPAVELAALAAAEGLGELHETLAPAAVWRSPKVSDPVRGSLAERLTELGWRDRLGRLEREVAASLAVLARPAVAYYGWLTHDHATISVLAAAIGKEAVLAVRQPDSTVWLSNTTASRLADGLVAQTPDVRRGQGTPCTVELAELRGLRRTGSQRAAGGVVLRRASQTARHLAELVDLPTTGAGELYVAVRDDNGRVHTHDDLIGYADTAHGRYLTLTDRRQVLVTPADEAVLTEQLHRVHRRLSASRT